MNVAVLITCHNRREKTLSCLESLFAQSGVGDIDLSVWLVDDGSEDGTAAAVRRLFPTVRMIAGNGDLFWCGGMRVAWAQAARERPAAYLWLNDDVRLYPGALGVLRASALAQPDAILIGSCACGRTGLLSYGGRRRLGLHPGKLGPVPPGEALRPCDTFEGNIVWVPQSVFARIGPLAPYRHAMGDIDYGYRAQAAGIGCFVAPGYLGACSANARAGTWEDETLSRRVRWRKIFGPKGLPPFDWWRFCRRHGGWRAPRFFVSPYCRILLRR